MLLLWSLIIIAGCDRGAADGSGMGDDAGPHEQLQTTGGPGIALSETARRNLGVTFAKVEPRRVRSVVRVPGEFELRPGAAREYHTVLPGRVSLIVTTLQRVQAHDVLFYIDSPKWRELQHEITETKGQIEVAEAQRTIAAAQIEETKQAIAILDARIAKLKAANINQVELEARRQEQANTLPRLQAQLGAKVVELREAREHYESILRVAAAVTGIDAATLAEPVEDSTADPSHEAKRYWQTIERLPIRAAAAGVVERIAVTPGAWTETGAMVMRLIDDKSLRFHAHALQTDINLFRAGQSARIVPPRGGSVPLDQEITDTIVVGVSAHPDDRTLPLYVTPSQLPPWAKPGVSGYLEVVLDDTQEAKLTIPTSAVVRDELKYIFFRRDADDPNRVLRVEADLGVSDGRYVEVLSGVKQGDEVVVDGAYSLKLAGGARQAPSGYHYHADGSLHKDHE